MAVVGASPRADRPSHEVTEYLIGHTEWEVFLVNPMCDNVLGRATFATLADLPTPPDLVDVFRRVELLARVTQEAIDVGAKAIWFQLGLTDDLAAARAEAAGVAVVQNRCLRVEHERLIGSED